jgi:hypothetical protein
MVPALLLFAAVPYAVIGDVVLSFRIANFVALALLVLAGCLILDEVSAPTVVKACAAFTLAVMALPAAVFDPIQPYLVAVALTALAVALAGIDDGPPEALVAIAHVGATLAAPAGIIAPLYGLARRWRIGRRDLASLFAFVPALLIWLAIQFWARGGLLGLADLVRPGRVAGDTVMWGEGAFAMLGLYFVVTCFGGFSVLLVASQGTVRRAISERPELLALALPVCLFVATAGLDVPRTVQFFLPFWLIVLGVWVQGRRSALTVPLILSMALTLYTARPGFRLDDMSYYANYFPYTVHAGRARVTYPELWSLWTIRLLVVATAIVALSVWQRPRRHAVEAA